MKGTDSFRQARNYTPASRGRGAVRLWVVHDMEAPEGVNTAEACRDYFATTDRRASAHVSVDVDTIAGSVLYDDVAWSAPSANSIGIHVEHAGYARQTRAEWLDPYGVNMLDRSARLFALVGFGDFGIPPRWLSDREIAEGASGICDHWGTTRAFGIVGGHTDCGSGFPADWYVERCRLHVRNLFGSIENPAPNPPAILPPRDAPPPIYADPVVSRLRNPTAPLVREVQGLLGEVGLDPGPVDGVFGRATEAAVLELQRRSKDKAGTPLVVDGIVGPTTLETLRILAYLVRIGKAQDLPPAPLPPRTPPVPAFPGVGGRMIREGLTGPDVRAVQSRLRDRGWTITVDGIFGSGTRRIVEAFQREKGLGVDGVVGPKTWVALWTAPT